MKRIFTGLPNRANNYQALSPKYLDQSEKTKGWHEPTSSDTNQANVQVVDWDPQQLHPQFCILFGCIAAIVRFKLGANDMCRKSLSFQTEGDEPSSIQNSQCSAGLWHELALSRIMQWTCMVQHCCTNKSPRFSLRQYHCWCFIVPLTWLCYVVNIDFDRLRRWFL